MLNELVALQKEIFCKIQQITWFSVTTISILTFWKVSKWILVKSFKAKNKILTLKMFLKKLLDKEERLLFLRSKTCSFEVWQNTPEDILVNKLSFRLRTLRWLFWQKQPSSKSVILFLVKFKWCKFRISLTSKQLSKKIIDCYQNVNIWAANIEFIALICPIIQLSIHECDCKEWDKISKKNWMMGDIHTANSIQHALACFRTRCVLQITQQLIITVWAIIWTITHIRQMDTGIWNPALEEVVTNSGWRASSRQWFIIAKGTIPFTITNIGPWNTVISWTFEKDIAFKIFATFHVFTMHAWYQVIIKW